MSARNQMHRACEGFAGPVNPGPSLHNADGCACAGEGEDAAEEASAALSRSLVPLFDAFWQGRLIPGAQIESLPFIEVIHMAILKLP